MILRLYEADSAQTRLEMQANSGWLSRAKTTLTRSARAGAVCGQEASTMGHVCSRVGSSRPMHEEHLAVLYARAPGRHDHPNVSVVGWAVVLSLARRRPAA